jgi:UDP-glucose 4-epimerase
MDAVAFRYFNAAGCSPDGDLGEHHEPETHLIPNLCKAYFEKKEFQINGVDYSTPDGSCIRDYIHVVDLVRYHHEAMTFLNSKDGHGFHDFNLGSEVGYSVWEVLKNFEEVVGQKLNVKVGPRRPGDPEKLVACSLKAKKILNFQTEYDLKNMIAHTLNYFNRHFY